MLNFLHKRPASRRQPLGGRYKLLGQLGVGGFGQTFRAQDLHLPGQPLCVVKHLKPQFGSTTELQIARRLFETEAKVLYQLGSHPQIPSLLAHFEQDSEFYLVQELVEGHSLADEFATGVPWPEAQVINFLEGVLTTLTFVHQNRVIHRDLKPSNLIRRQQDSRVVLIDFGAVKQMRTQVITHTNGVSQTISIGTQGYMPNEQIAGRPQFSSDVYAVGIMGIQALSGRHPQQLVPHPQTGELDWQPYVPNATAELVAILDRMVRYDFRSRYLTAQETLAAVQALPPALRNHRPAIAQPPVNASSDSRELTIGVAPASPGHAQPTVPMTTLPSAAASLASRQQTLAVMGRHHHRIGVGVPLPATTGRKLPLIVGGAIATLLGLSLLVWRLFPSPSSTTPDPVATVPTVTNAGEDTAENTVEESAATSDPPVAPPPTTPPPTVTPATPTQATPAQAPSRSIPVSAPLLQSQHPGSLRPMKARQRRPLFPLLLNPNPLPLPLNPNPLSLSLNPNLSLLPQNPSSLNPKLSRLPLNPPSLNPNLSLLPLNLSLNLSLSLLSLNLSQRQRRIPLSVWGVLM